MIHFSLNHLIEIKPAMISSLRYTSSDKMDERVGDVSAQSDYNI